MITIKTDTDGNVQVQNGRFVLLSGKEAMVQECWHRAMMFQGDDIFNKDKGLNRPGSLRGGFQSKDILESQIESLVEDNDEVYEARAEIKQTGDKYNLELEVNSIYGSERM